MSEVDVDVDFQGPVGTCTKPVLSVSLTLTAAPVNNDDLSLRYMCMSRAYRWIRCVECAAHLLVSSYVPQRLFNPRCIS